MMYEERGRLSPILGRLGGGVRGTGVVLAGLLAPWSSDTVIGAFPSHEARISRGLDASGGTDAKAMHHLFAGVIEALKCLEENVVTTVADANIGSIMGIGAPPWTGGYVQYVNTYGIGAFVYRCDELANKYGERFRAPAIVRKRSAEGATIT